MFVMHRLYRKSRIYVVKGRWFDNRYVKNDVSLCKLDVNVKNQTAVAVSVGSLNLSRKCGKSKGMQEKVSIMGVWC